MDTCSRFFTATRQEKAKSAKITPEMAAATAALPPELHVQPYYCRKDPELEAARHESSGNQENTVWLYGPQSIERLALRQHVCGVGAYIACGRD
jgi:hypothetical protein